MTGESGVGGGIAPIRVLRGTALWRRLVWSYRVSGLGAVLFGAGASLAYFRLHDGASAVCVLGGLLLMPVGGLIGSRSRMAMVRRRHTYQMEVLRRAGGDHVGESGWRWDRSYVLALVRDVLWIR